jgi:hypothetical protein
MSSPSLDNTYVTAQRGITEIHCVDIWSFFPPVMRANTDERFDVLRSVFGVECERGIFFEAVPLTSSCVELESGIDD